MAKTNPLFTILTLDESIKSILLSAGIKTEFDFDLAKLERICKQNALILSQKKIELMILHYCKTLKTKNDRVLKINVEYPSPSVVRIIFTIRLFGSNELPLLNPQELTTVVSSGEWRKASGEKVKK